MQPRCLHRAGMVLTYSALVPAALALLRVPVLALVLLWAVPLPASLVYFRIARRRRAAHRTAQAKAGCDTNAARPPQ